MLESSPWWAREGWRNRERPCSGTPRAGDATWDVANERDRHCRNSRGVHAGWDSEVRRGWVLTVRDAKASDKVLTDPAGGVCRVHGTMLHCQTRASGDWVFFPLRCYQSRTVAENMIVCAYGSDSNLARLT